MEFVAFLHNMSLKTIVGTYRFVLPRVLILILLIVVKTIIKSRQQCMRSSIGVWESINLIIHPRYQGSVINSRQSNW